jgi:hypothetical protein
MANSNILLVVALMCAVQVACIAMGLQSLRDIVSMVVASNATCIPVRR